MTPVGERGDVTGRYADFEGLSDRRGITYPGQFGEYRDTNGLSLR